MIHVEKHTMRDGSLHVIMSGDIDDQFDGEHVLMSANDGKRVVLHLGGIRTITSIGVRNLDDFVAAFAPREITLIHISPAVAVQLVMIPNLCKNARVESAKLPFLCAGCGAEGPHSVPWRHNAHLENPPKCSCGQTMQLDGVPEQYLPA